MCVCALIHRHKHLRLLANSCSGRLWSKMMAKDVRFVSFYSHGLSSFGNIGLFIIKPLLVCLHLNGEGEEEKEEETFCVFFRHAPTRTETRQVVVYEQYLNSKLSTSSFSLLSVSSTCASRSKIVLINLVDFFPSFTLTLKRTANEIRRVASSGPAGYAGLRI